MKKVTIMIPTYNQARYIGQAIESAMEIDYPNLDIVISDDCSIDNTQEVVNQYLSDERVKYFRNSSNLGRVGNYRRTLYEYATGDYVLNLDGDDWLLKTDFISKAVELLEYNTNMSCVLGDRENYDELKDQYRTFSNKDNPYVNEIMDGNEFFINMPKSGFIFSHFSCLYKRDLALELDFYSKDIVSSDIESIGKLYINHDVGYLPITVGTWRAHTSNDSYVRNVLSTITNLSKYDSLYEYAFSQHIFKLEDLDDWLFRSKVGNLSQDIIYELRALKFKRSSLFFSEIFKYDIKIASASFIKAMKKIFYYLLKKRSL